MVFCLYKHHTRKLLRKDKQKKIINYESESLKRGYFNEEELILYKLSKEEIDIVLEYQKRLPVLQQDNDSWIDAKNLWEQLGVGRDYTGWINQQISDLELIQAKDYFIDSLSKGNQIKGRGGDRKSIGYIIQVSIAKEIAMVAGAKGGNTSKELKENSKLARKYFVAVEEAFKKRADWNNNRKGSLIMCKELRGAIIKHYMNLIENLPTWIKSTNMYQNEFCLLNSIIIGMSAQKYREINRLKPNEPIRDTFTDDQLYYVKRLELYDAQLINTQQIFDYEQRKKILQNEFSEISRKSVRYV